MIDTINLMPAYATMLLMACIPIILIVDLFVPESKRDVSCVLAIIVTIGCAILSLLYCPKEPIALFSGCFIGDALTGFLNALSALAMAVTFIYGRRYINERAMTSSHLGGEYYTLALFCLLGQMVAISAGNFIVMYLGIELMTFPLYALLALKRKDERAVESSIKYFILGALGTGLMLYGISMLYGATATINFAQMSQVLQTQQSNYLILVFGTVFVVAGIAFKLGAVPFHMWVPDVFEGAPTAVSLLIAGAPKIAGIAICLRILSQALLPLALDWQNMLVVIAILSMALGNIAAIWQTNLKRMLAYSTIAHMGYMLLGMLSGVQAQNSTVATQAYASALYYIVVYVLSTLAAFGLMLALSDKTSEFDLLKHCKGLHKRHALSALIMMICMLSFAGVPPLVGFYGKFAVFSALVGVHRYFLAIIAVILAVIGAFFYLRVIKLMYFDAPDENQVPIKISADMLILLCFNALLIVVLGVFPSVLMDWCTQAVQFSLFT